MMPLLIGVEQRSYSFTHAGQVKLTHGHTTNPQLKFIGGWYFLVTQPPTLSKISYNALHNSVPVENMKTATTSIQVTIILYTMRAIIIHSQSVATP